MWDTETSGVVQWKEGMHKLANLHWKLEDRYGRRLLRGKIELTFSCKDDPEMFVSNQLIDRSLPTSIRQFT